MKSIVGGIRNSCNGIKHNAIEHFCMELEAHKICEGWAIGEGNTTFPTNATRGNDS
jgi:hypothetical protein